MNIIFTSHIILHNSQRFEMKVKHSGKHIVNLVWIIYFQKLQKRFDHLNNFGLHVILKDEDRNIKGINNISNLFYLNF